jgi:glycosyltransferase involved in cell wall biosynthesis
MPTDNLRVLIVAEHASLKFGGEAALPLHYFRVLRKRSLETWLVVHERTRDELKSLFPGDFDRIHFVPDTFWHRLVFQCGRLLPARLSYFTFGLVLRVLTQLVQRRIIKRVVQEQQIDIIHQPIPVSPKEPSMIFDMGVPVVIGPMNGGMDYPPAFGRMQSRLVDLTLGIGSLFANSINTLIPGKRKATTLLVANPRTRDALPKGIRGKVIELVENGVDLSIWKSKPSRLEARPLRYQIQSSESETPVEETKTQHLEQTPQQPAKFVFVGRLVDWKAVDLLLLAFKRVVEQVPAELEIVGDGTERTALEAQAKELGLIQPQNQNTESITQEMASEPQEKDVVRFSGWLSQVDCAQRLLSAKTLVLPSLFECGGAVVLEAMAMGMPVIATNWGGPADYLDESCGILVNPASRDSFINDLAAAMLEMAKHPELCQAMGRAGRERVRDYFDWEVKVDTMLGIYQETIERYAAERTILLPNVKASVID